MPVLGAPRAGSARGGLGCDAAASTGLGGHGFANVYSRTDYSRTDYSRNDYSRNDYSRNVYSHADYSRSDYSRTDYSRTDYSPNGCDGGGWSVRGACSGHGVAGRLCRCRLGSGVPAMTGPFVAVVVVPVLVCVLWVASWNFFKGLVSV